MRQTALNILAWRQVKVDLQSSTDNDPERLSEVQNKIRDAERELPNRILNAYTNIVHWDTSGEIVGSVHQQGGSLWERMKKTQTLDLRGKLYSSNSLAWEVTR